MKILSLTIYAEVAQRENNQNGKVSAELGQIASRSVVLGHTIGGSRGPDSFVSTYKFFPNVAASGVGAPMGNPGSATAYVKGFWVTILR